MEFEKIKQFVNNFFEDNSIKEGLLKLEKPIRITENEYNDLIKDKYFVERYKGNGIYIEEFEKPENDNVFAEMMFAYYIEEDKILLTEIELWRTKRDTN